MGKGIPQGKIPIGGDLTHFVFSPLPVEMIQFDKHIVQMGWFNHQLDIHFLWLMVPTNFQTWPGWHEEHAWIFQNWCTLNTTFTTQKAVFDSMTLWLYLGRGHFWKGFEMVFRWFSVFFRCEGTPIWHRIHSFPLTKICGICSLITPWRV